MGQWIELIGVDELEPGDVTPVSWGTKKLVIYDADDGLYVTQAHCSHAGAALCDGYFDGHIIECPLHQACFDICDGRALGPPATRSLQTYPVRVVKSRIQILLE